jgi:DNA-binding NarL/FixJ family response regulator
VLVVDDHPAFRRALSSALSMIEDIEVAGEAGGGIAACEEAEQLDPDVIVMDRRCPIVGDRRDEADASAVRTCRSYLDGARGRGRGREALPPAPVDSCRRARV